MPLWINCELLNASMATLCWHQGQGLLDVTPNRLVNLRCCQPLLHISGRSKDLALVEKVLWVILGLNLQKTRKGLPALDLACKAKGSKVVGVVVDGRLIKGILKVTQVSHYMVLLVVIYEGLVSVVGLLS